MFSSLSKITADRIMDCLTGGGPEARAAKAVRAFRNDPTEAHEAEAIAMLNALDQNKLTELKQAARL